MFTKISNTFYILRFSLSFLKSADSFKIFLRPVKFQYSWKVWSNEIPFCECMNTLCPYMVFMTWPALLVWQSTRLYVTFTSRICFILDLIVISKTVFKEPKDWKSSYMLLFEKSTSLIMIKCVFKLLKTKMIARPYCSVGSTVRYTPWAWASSLRHDPCHTALIQSPWFCHE